jgi:hypothetical protein
MRRKFGVGLDLGQHVEAAAARQVEVQQDQPGLGFAPLPGGRCRRARAPSPSPQTTSSLAILPWREGLPGEPHVAGVVLDEEDLDGPARSAIVAAPCPIRKGEPEGRAAAWQSSLPTPRPPWRSTILLQIARPMPLPGYSSREWRLPEDDEDVVAVLRAECRCRGLARRGAIPHRRARRPARPRGGAGAPELDGVADEVLVQLGHLLAVGQVTLGNGPPPRRSAPVSPMRAWRFWRAAAGGVVLSSISGPKLPTSGADPGIGEQAVDQGLHPAGPVDGEADVLLRPRRRALSPYFFSSRPMKPVTIRSGSCRSWLAT